MKVVVLGKNSFIAGALSKRPEVQDWTFLSHSQLVANAQTVRNADVVINCALHPNTFKGVFDEASNFDARVASLIQDTPAKYIMVSSRSVYGHNGQGSEPTVFRSTQEDLRPDTAYGRAKLATEESLREILPEDRLTILRLTNIFGDEAGRNRFMGKVIDGLVANDCAHLATSPDARRDFLPVDVLAEYMVGIIGNLRAGTYNLASGIPVSVGNIVSEVVTGYGQGRYTVADPAFTGSFCLDMERELETFPTLRLLEEDEIMGACRAVGERARKLSLAPLY